MVFLGGVVVLDGIFEIPIAGSQELVSLWRASVSKTRAANRIGQTCREDVPTIAVNCATRVFCSAGSAMVGKSKKSLWDVKDRRQGRGRREEEL